MITPNIVQHFGSVWAPFNQLYSILACLHPNPSYDGWALPSSAQVCLILFLNRFWRSAWLLLEHFLVWYVVVVNRYVDEIPNTSIQDNHFGIFRIITSIKSGLPFWLVSTSVVLSEVTQLKWMKNYSNF